MAITYLGASAVATGSTSVALGAFTMNTGEAILIFVTTKPDTGTINTPAGWTPLSNVAGGGGTVGNGVGPTRGAWFFREKDATWSALPTISITSGNSSAAQAYRFSKSGTTIWDTAAATGVFGTSNTVTNCTATMGSSPDIASGDMLVAGLTSMDEGPTWSGQSITATGATIGAATEMSEAIETTTGNDVGGMTFNAPVTAGSSSAAPVVNATASIATRGTSSLIRLRELSGPTSITGSDSVGLSVSESASVSPIIFIAASDTAAITAGDGQSTLVSVNFDSNTDNHVSWFDATVVRTTADTYSGAGALHWTAQAAFSGVNLSNWPYYAGVTPGQALNFSVATKGLSGAHDTSVDWAISFYNESGTQQGSTTTVSLAIGSAWSVSTSNTITVPAGATRVGWDFSTNNAAVGSVILLDAIRVTSGSGSSPSIASSLSRTDTASISINEGMDLSKGINNRAKNPSFETELGTTATSNATISRVQDATAWDGQYVAVASIAASGGSGTLATTEATPILPNTQYTAGMRYRLRSGTPAGTQRLAVRQYNSAGVQVHSANFSLVNGEPDETWLEVSGTFVSEADASYVRVGYVSTLGAVSEIDMDGIQVNLGPTLLDYDPLTITEKSASDTIALSIGDGVPADTIRAYTFNEGSGTTAAEVNGGTAITGVPGWAAGRHDDAMYVNGVDGPQTTPFAVTSDFTLMADVYIVGSGAMGYNCIFDGDFGTLQELNNTLEFYPTQSGVSSALSHGAWHQVAISSNGVTTRTFVDGTQIATGTVTDGQKSGTGSIQLGGLKSTAGYTPNIRYDNLRIFNFAMTSEAQVASYNGVAVQPASSAAQVEEVGGADPISGTDTASLAVSETSSIASSLSRTDTASIAVSETTVLDRQIGLSDGAAISVSESRSIASSLSRTDTAALAVSEESSMVKFVSATDTASLASTEIVGVAADLFLPGADSAALGVTDTSTVYVTSPASDTSSIALLEATSIAVTLSASDAAGLALADNSSLTSVNDVSVSDTASVGVSESVAVEASLSRDDTVSIGLTETTSLFKEMVASDDAALTVAEQAGNDVTQTADDSVALSVDESTHRLKAFGSDDTVSLSIDENVSLFKDVSATDSVSLTITEVSGLDSNLPGAESVSLGVAEQASIFADTVTSDSIVLGLDEQGVVDVALSVTDEAVIVLEDTGSLFTEKFANDAGSISVSEVSSDSVIGTEETTDTLSVGMTEEVALLVPVAASDSAAVSVTESRDIAVSSSASDTINVGLTENRAVLVSLEDDDTLSVALAETANSSETNYHVASDTAGLAVEESASVTVALSSQDDAAITLDESVTQFGSRPGGDILYIGLTETVHINVFTSASDTMSLSVDEDSYTTEEISSSDVVSLSVSESSFKQEPDMVQALVYQNGEWVHGTAVQFKNGRWRTIDLYAFKNGQWVKA